jgi:hypothetical protein
MGARDYDPFMAGPCAPEQMTAEAPDRARNRTFALDIWYPGDMPGAGGSARPSPLVVYSHSSGGNRRSATFLCRHFAGHGYVVAAMDHSEVVADDLRPRAAETPKERAAWVDDVVASRVPDVRFLVDYVLDRFGGRGTDGITLDPARIGLVGHSFGGWTVLATPEVDRRADHQHFVDDVEGDHEAIRATTLPGDAAWIPAAMWPVSELTSGEHAQLFARGLTLAHLDATLRGLHAAEQFWSSDVEAQLAERGVEAVTLR